ncbi:MAG: 2OG-Fe(II) oxygenase [Pseudomonadota bacterium]
MKNNEATLQRVAAHDAAGNHDDAVDVLAGAAKAGDMVALTVLGKRLMVGDRAPYLPRDGVGMIFDAAKNGVAEAVAQMAVFQCTGIYQTKNWQHCVNSLTWAARLGWVPAREQLLLLHGSSLAAAAAQLQSDDEAFWLQLGQTLDLNYWFKPEPGDALHVDPRVQRFSNFIPLNICELLVRQSAVKLQPALVYDPINRRNIRYKTRTNTIAQFNLVENDVVHFLLQEKMSAACGVPMVQMEATAILNYQPGQEISNHYDFVDPELVDYEKEIAENGQRIITFLIYLNNEYTGGETAFPQLGFEHRGSAGEGLYFVNSLPDGAPDLRMLHAGKPPLAGEKWIVSQFIRNRPVKYITD